MIIQLSSLSSTLCVLPGTELSPRNVCREECRQVPSADCRGSGKPGSQRARALSAHCGPRLTQLSAHQPCLGSIGAPFTLLPRLVTPPFLRGLQEILATEATPEVPYHCRSPASQDSSPGVPAFPKSRYPACARIIRSFSPSPNEDSQSIFRLQLRIQEPKKRSCPRRGKTPP